MKPNPLIGESTEPTEQYDQKMETGLTAAPEIMDNSPGVDYFNSLPDELIIMIWRHVPQKDKVQVLTRCGMVCKRWQRIALDESLWANSVIAGKTIPLTSLARLMRRGIRTLDMSAAKVSDPDPWRKCFPKKYKSKLEELNISSVQISKRGLAHLLKPCHNLLHLHAAGNFLLRTTCDAIASNAQLESLTLSEADGLDEPGVTAILNGCQNLKLLHLGGANLSPVVLTAITSNLKPSLTSLSLNNCYNLTDQHVSDLVDRCPNLQFLDLAGNPNLTEFSLVKAHSIKNLELVFDPSRMFLDDSDEDDDDDDIFDFFDDDGGDDYDIDDEDYDDFFFDGEGEQDSDYSFDPAEGEEDLDGDVDVLMPIVDEDDDEWLDFGSEEIFDSDECESFDGDTQDSESNSSNESESSESEGSNSESETSNSNENSDHMNEADNESNGSNDTLDTDSGDVVVEVETENSDDEGEEDMFSYEDDDDYEDEDD